MTDDFFFFVVHLSTADVFLGSQMARFQLPEKAEGPEAPKGRKITGTQRGQSLVNYLLNSENDYSLWKVP